ncbi:MAG: rRNA pseudouridine synthase [Anaerolineae bacterium]|nr:rRNA pseudouridine synthase [Anaerolineae bacterium]MBN8617499.1 rRNA pseudouridine synthase [Anaerolineae bacterium]
MKERVQKLMAQANVGSRRSCETLISQGRVRVNGKVIKLGDQADPNTDIIEVDGNKLAFPDKKLYIAFNKPKYVLSTDEPHEGDTRKIISDFLPFKEHLFSAGRLDADSEGLMVLTNDGELANMLTHPRYRHTKTYKVVISGLPTQETLDRWQKGVELLNEDGTIDYTGPCSIQMMEGGKDTTLRIVMTEGKKRQIRRTAALFGHVVKSLIRTQMGKLMLGTLRPGEWRELTAKDLVALKSPADELRNIPGKGSGRGKKAGLTPAKPHSKGSAVSKVPYSKREKTPGKPRRPQSGRRNQRTGGR